jgi:putative hydrolase of the HAD superfamily
MAPQTTRAVFLDVLGTLIELEPPWISLREMVPAEIGDERLIAAMRVEMAYYREHAHEGRDEESLADLRERCASLVSRELGLDITADQLVSAVRFSAYPDAVPALLGLRDRGLRLIAVSNWDCSLPRVLAQCGLDEMLDGTVTSAEVGAPKPDPAIFLAALELAGCEAEEALHVGDRAEEDVAGARAAGIRPLLIDREGPGGDISSLEQIDQHL